MTDGQHVLQSMEACRSRIALLALLDKVRGLKAK